MPEARLPEYNPGGDQTPSEIIYSVNVNEGAERPRLWTQFKKTKKGKKKQNKGHKQPEAQVRIHEAEADEPQMALQEEADEMVQNQVAVRETNVNEDYEEQQHELEGALVLAADFVKQEDQMNQVVMSFDD